MIALLLGLLLFSRVVIVGPGHLSYAGDGTLEAVAERRLANGWGLTRDWRGYAVLVAVPDCESLNRSGWLIVDGKILTTQVVDCAQEKHRQQMIDNGLLADVNKENLVHLRGWLILR